MYKAYASSNLSGTSYPHAIKVYKLEEETVPCVDASSFTLSPTTLNVDDTGTFSASATVAEGASVTYSYASSDDDALYIEGNEYVTGSTTGDYTVTVTATPSDLTKYTAVNKDFMVSIVNPSAPTATLSATELSFGEVEVGQSKALTFTVTPVNLTGNLAIAVDNDKYTVSPTSILQTATTAQTITVTAAPTAVDDDMDGTITVSGGGITSQTVTLTVTPYQVANVTLVATNDKGTFKVGGDVVTSITSRVGSSVAVTAVPISGYKFTGWTAVGATPASSSNATETFTFASATPTLTATFAEADVYEKLADASDLADGDKVIIVSYNSTSSKYFAMGGQHETGTYRKNVEVSIESDQLVDPSSAVKIVTLEEVEDGWLLNTDEGYIVSSSAKSVTNTSEKSNATVTTIDITEGVAVLKMGDNYLKYNAGTPRFTTYASGQNDLYLFRLNDGKSPASLSYATASYNTHPNASFATPTLTNPHDLMVTYASDDTDVATVNAATGAVTIKEEGTATITASFAGNDDYRKGSASYTITVARAEAGLSFSPATATLTLDEDFSKPTFSNPNDLSVSFSTNNAEVADVNASTGVITFKNKAGVAVITATSAQTDEYKAGSATFTLTVNKKTATITASDIDDLDATTERDDFYTTTSDGSVSFTSTDATVAEVVEGVLKGYKPGTADITISVAATDIYNAVDKTISVTVTSKPGVAPVGPSGTGFVKVTSTEDLKDGQYLIVYEGGNVAFNGALATLDANNNTISVTINEGVISATDALKAAVFTYNATAKTLKSASGKYIGQTSDANGLAQNAETTYENTISFDGGGNANIVSGGAYLRFNSAADQLRFRYYKSSSYTSQQAIQLYKLNEVATFDISIGTTGWRTMVSAQNVEFPDEVEAYIVTSNDGETARLTQVNAVEAGVPVVLKGAEGDHTLTIVDDEDCDDASTNLLAVSDETTGNGVYVLAKRSGAVGFYLWQGGSLGAGRVYLPLPVVGDVREFIGFGFDTETGVEAAGAQLPEGNIVYDLSGRRIQKPTRGLYIVNGKKTFIK